MEELHDAAVRVLTAFNESDPAKRRDVVWLAEESQRSGTRRVLRIAPAVGRGLLRASLFVDATVILTSATLVVGGSFDALATTWGLPVAGNSARGEAPGVGDVTASGKVLPGGDSDTETLRWRGLDAGSPSTIRARPSSTSPGIYRRRVAADCRRRCSPSSTA